MLFERYLLSTLALYSCRSLPPPPSPLWGGYPSPRRWARVEPPHRPLCGGGSPTLERCRGEEPPLQRCVEAELSTLPHCGMNLHLQFPSMRWWGWSQPPLLLSVGWSVVLHPWKGAGVKSHPCRGVRCVGVELSTPPFCGVNLHHQSPSMVVGVSHPPLPLSVGWRVVVEWISTPLLF